MRELKFKVWNGKEMLGPFDLSQNPIYWEGLEDGERLLYTGLKDKNSVEIYEGYILEFNNCNSGRTGGYKDDEILKGEVVFSYGMWIIKCANDIEYELFEIHINDEEIEILGNIYENKELLGE